MGLPARAGLGLGLPGQTDAVDQFVAREANGYKAEGFSRQRVLISMNRNEESSLPGITSMLVMLGPSAGYRDAEAPTKRQR